MMKEKGNEKRMKTKEMVWTGEAPFYITCFFPLPSLHFSSETGGEAGDWD